MDWGAGMPLIVSTDEQAYAALKAILEGQVLAHDLVLDDWPSLRIRLTGEKFHNSLTPSVMKGFVDLQNAVYRSYATAKYGVPDIRKLSPEERSSLEIVVEVEEGSSILEVDFQELLETLFTQVGARMEPVHLITIVLSLGLLWAGKESYKSYLSQRKTIRMAELRTDERRAELEHVASLSVQETERARILVQAAQREPALHNISRQAYDAKTDLIKSLSSADTIEIDGIDITGEAARELVINARRKSSEIRLDGNYRILRVDTSQPAEFRVRISNAETGARIDATVKDDILNAESRTSLQAAEWNRTPIFLGINAKSLDNTIKDAVVVQVGAPRAPDPDPDDSE